MTNRTHRLPTHCSICTKKLSSRNRASAVCGTLPGSYDDMCTFCYEQDPEDADVTHVTADATIAIPTGRKNRSHADCKHARTPAGRAACRRSNA